MHIFFFRYLHGTLGHIEQRNVESTASEVVDQDVMYSRLLVQLVSNSSCSGLFDYAHHFQTGLLVALCGCLALVTVKLRWYCNDCLVYLIVLQIESSDSQQKLQYLRSYFFRSYYWTMAGGVYLECHLAEVRRRRFYNIERMLGSILSNIFIV